MDYEYPLPLKSVGFEFLCKQKRDVNMFVSKEDEGKPLETLRQIQENDRKLARPLHDSSNPGCPRNHPSNQTICTCEYNVSVVPSEAKYLYEEARRKTPHQQRVESFMLKAQQEVPDAPTVPSEKVRELRAKLIFEECVRELIVEGLGVEIVITDAFGHRFCFNSTNLGRDSRLKFVTTQAPNLQLIADGCADGSVVITGTLSACGIADLELLEEVDRSNLSKFALPSCPVHEGDMVHNGGGKYQCSAPISGLPGTTSLPRQCHLTAEGPYCSSEGKWVKGPQYSPADIEGVLARQMSAVSPGRTCAICGNLSYGDLQVCYDHCKLDENLDPRDPTIAECVALVVHRLAEKYGPPQTSKGDVAEGVITTAAVQAKQLKFDSGGIVMCPHCRNPLSDEMVKDLKSGKRQQGGCPGCTGTFSYADLSNPRIH